jgi:predicted KAP-like P-loop ATPase
MSRLKPTYETLTYEGSTELAMLTEKRNNPSDWFSADRPIKDRSQDKLGRRYFSEATASAIRGWSGRESLTIALYGPWGNGKSSIKNMILDALGTDSGIDVVDFNPWQFANHVELTEAFFDEVAVALGRRSQKRQRSLLNRWRRYAQRLHSSATLVTLAIAPIKITLVIAGVILIFCGVVRPGPIFTTVVGSLLVIAAPLLWISKVAEQIGNFLAAGPEVGKESLEEIRSKLRSSLSDMQKPLLIVLDDLDRLRPSELTNVVQLVKANGDFPNLIYLILCDRNTVEKHLSLELKVNGRDYLEKIVQVSFNIPKLDDRQVRELLSEGISELLRSEHVAHRFDPQRWANVFWSGLNIYFTTLRQVNRYLSTLPFHISLLTGDSAFEVNPIDLIAIEALRVFEPEAYQRIALNKILLTSVSQFQRADKATAEAALNTIMASAPEERRAQLSSLLQQLFPTIQWVSGGPFYTAESSEEWYRDLRICSRDVFDRYFQLGISADDLAESDIQTILSSLGSREELNKLFRELRARGLFEKLLERLEAYKSVLDTENVLPFCISLCDEGDYLSSESSGMFEQSPLMHAERIIYWYLKRVTSPGRRAEILAAAFAESKGTTLPISLLGYAHRLLEDSNQEQFIEEKDLAKLRIVVVEKIRSASRNGLLSLPQMPRLLQFWKSWGNEDEASRFVRDLTAEPSGALSFVKAFVVRSLLHQSGDVTHRERRYLRRRDLEEFIDVEMLEHRVQGIELSAISLEEQEALTEFQKMLERKRSGKPDEGPLFDDDD